VKNGAAFAAFWGLLLVILAAGLTIWSGGVGVGLLLAQGGFGAWALALLQLRRPPQPRARLLPRLSLPTVVLALGLATAALGLTAGLWLILIGAEIALFALVWLAREIVTERRLLR
jgi:hypothetical protein